MQHLRDIASKKISLPKIYITLGKEIIQRAQTTAKAEISHIVSLFDLEPCSEVIKDGVIEHNTYDFLLVFYSNFGRISYRFCITVDFMPK